MRDWPWISDNALTLYCGVLFVENHTCMHVDETTGKCRSLTQSYKWVFFSDTNPDTCVPVSFRGPLITVLYVVIFCHAPPPFFSLSLYNPSRQQRITCSIWSHYFMRTTSTSLHFTYETYEGISFKRNSARCRVDILLYLHVSSICLYPLIFFLSFVKSDEI